MSIDPVKDLNEGLGAPIKTHTGPITTIRSEQGIRPLLVRLQGFDSNIQFWDGECYEIKDPVVRERRMRALNVLMAEQTPIRIQYVMERGRAIVLAFHPLNLTTKMFNEKLGEAYQVPEDDV